MKKQTQKKTLTIAKPTSAFFKAGPSLVPSPVTATTCLCSMTVLSMIPEEEVQDYWWWAVQSRALAGIKTKKAYLWPGCAYQWGTSGPGLVVWARSCQCVLVRSGKSKRVLWVGCKPLRWFGKLCCFTVDSLPPFRCVSAGWTLCPPGRWSRRRVAGCRTWWRWPGLCWCCRPSPSAQWCLHAGTSWWHQGPLKGSQEEEMQVTFLHSGFSSHFLITSTSSEREKLLKCIADTRGKKKSLV